MDEVTSNTGCFNTQTSGLSCMQVNILQFAKRESFHATLTDFIEAYCAAESEAVSALKNLRQRRIVSMPPDLLGSWIGVTNYGWNLMGWGKEDDR